MQPFALNPFTPPLLDQSNTSFEWLADWVAPSLNVWQFSLLSRTSNWCYHWEYQTHFSVFYIFFSFSQSCIDRSWLYHELCTIPRRRCLLFFSLLFFIFCLCFSSSRNGVSLLNVAVFLSGKRACKRDIRLAYSTATNRLRSNETKRK